MLFGIIKCRSKLLCCVNLTRIIESRFLILLVVRFLILLGPKSQININKLDSFMIFFSLKVQIQVTKILQGLLNESFYQVPRSQLRLIQLDLGLTYTYMDIDVLLCSSLLFEIILFYFGWQHIVYFKKMRLVGDLFPVTIFFFKFKISNCKSADIYKTKICYIIFGMKQIN